MPVVVAVRNLGSVVIVSLVVVVDLEVTVSDSVWMVSVGLVDVLRGQRRREHDTRCQREGDERAPHWGDHIEIIEPTGPSVNGI